ncbi:MAG: hypothetical protein JNK46_02605 [Methylobacteriaceae bacterium]|nr:hypothetical protein [Methylobacteriaceae bacterium]
MSLALLAAAFAAGFLYIVSPGPAFLALFALAAQEGRGAGARFVAGHLVGDVVWGALALAAIVGVSQIGWADAPALMGEAFLGFLAGDLVLVFSAGLPAVRRFVLRHGAWVTRGVGLMFIAFGARSIADAATGFARRS